MHCKKEETNKNENKMARKRAKYKEFRRDEEESLSREDGHGGEHHSREQIH